MTQSTEDHNQNLKRQ